MLPLIMALAGLVKGETIDRQQEQRDRQLAATTQALSPWTGLRAGPIEKADPLGNAMAFGMSGKQMDQNQAKLKDDQAMNEAYRQYLDRLGQQSSNSPSSSPVAPYGMSPGAAYGNMAMSPYGFLRKQPYGGY